MDPRRCNTSSLIKLRVVLDTTYLLPTRSVTVKGIRIGEDTTIILREECYKQNIEVRSREYNM